MNSTVNSAANVGGHQRTVLLVVHTGREEATETARRVEKVLGDRGIALRVLTAEAVDKGRNPGIHRHPSSEEES